MVTARTRAQVQRVTDNSGILALLKISHPDIETIRVVNDTRPWVIGDDTWIGLPFRFRLPHDAMGESARGGIEIDNVGREMTTELEKLPPGASLRMTVYCVSRAAPEEVDYEFSAALTNVRATVATVTAQLGNDDAWRAPAVRSRFDPTIAPGLFTG